MQRYRVQSRATPELAEAWDRYLAGHVAEVAVKGAFAGASLVVDPDGRRTCDYVATEGGLARYLAQEAPALRADSEAKFPSGIDRARETAEVRAHVSAALAWESLGLVDASGAPVVCPADGPFTLAVFAPWCEDCETGFPALAERVASQAGRAAFVGIYASPSESASFAARHGATAPLWFEPGAKDEASRVRSAHAWLRQISGDGRRWGVPAVRSLFVHAGRFVLVAP